MQEDVLNNNNAKALMRFVKDNNTTLGDLQAKYSGTKNKSAVLDRMMSELGFNDLDEAQNGIDEYNAIKGQIEDLKNNIKILRGEIKRGEDIESYDDPKYYGSMMGGVAGFEMDDEGSVTFNPAKALLGIGGMAVASKK